MNDGDRRREGRHWKARWTRSIAAFKNNLTKVRTGRANPALLDTVHVDYYGSMLPISQVANLSLLDARTIGIQPLGKGHGCQDREGHPGQRSWV